jgi:integrase
MGIQRLPSGRYRLQIRRAALRIDAIYDSEKAARRAQAQFLKRRGERGLTLDAAWARYLESRNFLEKKSNTQRSEETHIKAALARLGERALAAITADDIDELIVARQKAGKRPDTVRNEVAALSAVFAFAQKKSMVSANPCIGVRRPSIERKNRRMAPGDQGALMTLVTHPKYRYRAVARLCLLVRETGARPGEWVVAQWRDLDFDARKITFQNTKYKSEPRTIPLTGAALRVLGDQLEDITLREMASFGDSEWIFPAIAKSGELTAFAYSGTVRDVKSAGLLPKAFRPHSGRHEYISSLVEDSDLDDSRIMTLVGHHSPASMQIYTHARGVRYRAQLEALEASRRIERTREIATATGMPVTLVQSYLERRRESDLAEGILDTGEELLFDPGVVADLQTMSHRLGKTDADRIRTLLRIRAKKSGVALSPVPAAPSGAAPAQARRTGPSAADE